MIEKLEDNPNAEALSWLLEMELVSSPYVLNSLILNIFSLVKGVKDAEFVIDERQKKLLVYLKLSWFSQRFRAKRTEDKVMNLLDQALPSFQKRIVFDRTVLEKAMAIMEKR